MKSFSDMSTDGRNGANCYTVHCKEVSLVNMHVEDVYVKIAKVRIVAGFRHLLHGWFVVVDQGPIPDFDDFDNVLRRNQIECMNVN